MQVQVRTHSGVIMRAKRGMHGTCPNMPAVDILKATQQGVESVQCGCRLGCSRWGAHSRNLANTTEPFICSSDVALCQITLTIEVKLTCSKV